MIQLSTGCELYSAMQVDAGCKAAKGAHQKQACTAKFPRIRCGHPWHDGRPWRSHWQTGCKCGCPTLCCWWDKLLEVMQNLSCVTDPQCNPYLLAQATFARVAENSRDATHKHQCVNGIPAPMSCWQSSYCLYVPDPKGLREDISLASGQTGLTIVGIAVNPK